MISSPRQNLPPYYNLSIPKQTVYRSQVKEKQFIEPSEPLIKYHLERLIINETVLKMNYNVIKNDINFRNVDAVVCMFYPSHCQFFIPFNKTVIFIAAHRFTIKRCSNQDVSNLIHFLFSYPDQVLVYAGGLYDREYINYYTGYSVPIIYASSLFAYQQPDEYHPEYEEYLVAPLHNREVVFLSNMTDACNNQGISCNFTTVRKKFGKNWRFEELTRFKAVIVFPYAVLSYYLNDLFAACIPVFVPSPEFLVTLLRTENTGGKRDRTMVDYRNNGSYYCRRTFQYQKSKNTIHPYSPEDDSKESQLYWFRFATFYTPASIQFDNWNDLALKLKTTNLREHFHQRHKENEDIIMHNENMWKQLFSKIKKRSIPQSYKEALSYYNTTSFFVYQ